MNSLEVNATIALLKRIGLLPADYGGDTRASAIVAHVYDICVRHGVSRSAIERELAALVREHNGNGNTGD